MATLEEETLEEETYPILLCTFDKYFWRSGLTLQVSVSRLDPFVYPATLCAVKVARTRRQAKESPTSFDTMAYTIHSFHSCYIHLLPCQQSGTPKRWIM